MLLWRKNNKEGHAFIIIFGTGSLQYTPVPPWANTTLMAASPYLFVFLLSV